MSGKYKDSHSLWISVFSNLKRKKKTRCRQMHMTGKKERRGDKRKGNLKASILRTQIQTFTIKCMQTELIHLYAINYVVSFCKP